MSQVENQAEKLANNAWTLFLSRLVVICMPILFGGFIWFCADAYSNTRQAQSDMKRELKDELTALRQDINSANAQSITLLQGIAEQRSDIKVLYNTTMNQQAQIQDLRNMQRQRR